MMAYTGRLCLERGTFFWLQVYERVGILIFSWEYTKGKGNLSFGSVKGPKRLTDEFYGFIKSKKRSVFVIEK